MPPPAMRAATATGSRTRPVSRWARVTMEAACAASATTGRRANAAVHTASDQAEVWRGAMAPGWRRASGAAVVP